METQQIFGKNIVLDKIKKHGWVLRDEPGVPMMVNKHELRIDHSYQRDFREERANKMAANWSWVACGCLTVADRDGDFYVVVGQHRLAAAMKRSDIKELPCLVFESRGIEQEAAGFVSEALDHKSIDWVDRLRAMNIYGDQVAVKVTKLFSDCGRVAGRTPSGNSVACIGAVYNQYSKNPDIAEGIFRLMAVICEGQPIDSRLFLALSYIEERMSGASLYRTPHIRSKLIKIGPNVILDEIARASALYKAGGKRVWAKAALEVINKGMKQKVVLGEE